jgi:hypothetical protein
MDKRDARALIGGFLSKTLQPKNLPGLLDLVDAHRILNYPMPETLGADIAKEWQKEVPPGYRAVVWAEGRVMRFAVVKEKFLNRFVQMVDNPNDITDIS